MKIEFNTKGYDPFIDFLKAYCIIWVVIGHIVPSEYLNYILYPIIGACQVPLFLLIQSFHSFKKDKPVFDIRKIMTRIIIPFVIIQALIIAAKLVVNPPLFGNRLINSVLVGGGMGLVLIISGYIYSLPLFYHGFMFCYQNCQIDLQ